MKRFLRRWALPIIVACVALYGGLYFWGAHSEAYRFLAQAVRTSPEVQQRVGDVRSVTLSPIGGYSEKFVGSHDWAAMTLDVVGTKGNVTVKADAQKANGSWEVSEAWIGGVKVKLN